MGISCSILFRKSSNKSVTELYNTIKNICISNHFYLDIIAIQKKYKAVDKGDKIEA